MEHYLALVGIAVVLFASTNIDDIFVLLGFFSDPKFAFRHIAWGQYLGIAGLYGVSVVASLISLVIPAVYIGLLGLLPIAIGIKKAADLRKDVDADDAGEIAEPGRSAYGNVLAVAAVTAANGGDNISIYTPMFATRSAVEIAVIGLVFIVMTLAWLVIAHWLTNHRSLGVPIRRYGYRVIPFVLVALGGLILYEAGTISFFLTAEYGR